MKNNTNNVGFHQQTDAFKEHIEKTSTIVKNWPEWKQNALGTLPSNRQIHCSDESQKK